MLSSHRLLVRVEPLGVVPKRRRLLTIILVAAATLTALLAPMIATGSLRALLEYTRVWSGEFASRSLFQVARYATAMMLTGLAGVIAFRSRVWNIGLEGYMIVGAIATAAAGFAGYPLLALLAAFAAAALWSLPVALGLLWGLSEVVSSMMMYYVSLYLLQYTVYKLWPSEYGGFPQTPPIGVMQAVIFGLPAMLYVSILFSILAHLFYRYTLPGLVLRLAGESEKAVTIAGYSSRGAKIAALLVSSGMAGLAGYHIASAIGYLSMGYAELGYGFAGITIAFLAGLEPLMVIPAALLMGLIYHFSSFASDLLPGGYAAYFYYAQGVILLSVLAARSLPRYRIIVRLVRRG